MLSISPPPAASMIIDSGGEVRVRSVAAITGKLPETSWRWRQSTENSYEIPLDTRWKLDKSCQDLTPSGWRITPE
jgi:hypothetical protein